MLLCAGLACRSTSGASGMLRVWISSTCSLPAASGGGTNSSISRRPGRSRAASMAPGRLVAAITCTPAGRSLAKRQQLRLSKRDLVSASQRHHSTQGTAGLGCSTGSLLARSLPDICAHQTPQSRCCVQPRTSYVGVSTAGGNVYSGMCRPGLQHSQAWCLPKPWLALQLHS